MPSSVLYLYMNLDCSIKLNGAKFCILQKQSGCFFMSCSLTMLLIGNTSDILKIVKFLCNLNQAK